jgi:hypothetical protein
MTAFFRPALVIPVAILAAAGASASSATTMPAAKPSVAPQHSSVVTANTEGDRDWHIRHHHAYVRDRTVDAPFAHVESGRHTIVDAPFAHVYVGRHGRHIVAPFVDLWMPN